MTKTLVPETLLVGELDLQSICTDSRNMRRDSSKVNPKIGIRVAISLSIQFYSQMLIEITI